MVHTKICNSYRGPLRDGLKCFLVEEEVFQSDERTLGVDLAAFQEHVAVALG